MPKEKENISNSVDNKTVVAGRKQFYPILTLTGLLCGVLLGTTIAPALPEVEARLLLGGVFGAVGLLFDWILYEIIPLKLSLHELDLKT